MLAQTLPSSCVTKYINDQVQVFADVLSLSKNYRESLRVVQEPNYAQAHRNAFIPLEVEGRRVQGFSGIEPVSPSAEKMKQPMESTTESQNSSDALLTWTAILRLRDFLKKTISNRLPQSEAGKNPCGVWLSRFAKSQFEACIALVEEELMKVLSATMNEAEMERVHSIFNSVLQFEIALLDSAFARKQTNLGLTQQFNSPWHPSNLIFATDFDVTCTVVDSSVALVRSAEAAARRSSRDFHPGKLLEDFDGVLDRHSQRTRETLRSLESPEKSGDEIKQSTVSARRDDLVPGMDPLLKPLFDSIKTSFIDASDKSYGDVPFDEAGLRKALKKLAELEVLCNQDTMAAGVLGGSTRDDVAAEAKQVILRDNCSEVLKQLVGIGTAIHIVSANWSRDLILGGLPELPKGKLFVHCNDLVFDECGLSNGMIDMTVIDAFDKEEMLRALRKIHNYLEENGNPKKTSSEQSTNSKTEREGEKMMVYLGDSHTDLLALLEADMGIVIGDTETVRCVMSLYGVQLLPLAEASAYLALARLNGTQRSWRHSGILFEAQGWADVESGLFGGMATTTPRSPSVAEPLKRTEDAGDQSLQQPRFDSDLPQERLPSVNLKLVQVVG